MNLRRINIEATLYALILLLALGLRFYQLDAAPLTDVEAHWAMQAWQLANPGASEAPLEIGPQPAYVFLTGVTFVLFSASNFAVSSCSCRIWASG